MSGWMSSLAQLVESHNQQGTGQNADWSNLSQMAGHFNAAQSSGGGLQDFQNNVQNGSSMAPGGTDTSVINKLLGMYEQRSGQSVQSPGFNMSSLAQFATEQTGQSMPTEMIEQLVKWKVQQMI